jgi:hypothetical protein
MATYASQCTRASEARSCCVIAGPVYHQFIERVLRINI